MNQITSLKREDGTMAVHEEEIAKLATDYFQTLFKAGRVGDMLHLRSGIEAAISYEDNQSFMIDYTTNEIFSAFKEMGPTNVPGFYGFPVMFF